MTLHPAPKPAVRRQRNSYRNLDKLAFVAAQRCLCWSVDPTGCKGRITVHHVRIQGGKKNDRRCLALCLGHHTTGPRSVHVLGRKRFEVVHRVDLRQEAAYYEQKYLNWKADLAARSQRLGDKPLSPEGVVLDSPQTTQPTEGEV